MGLNLHNIFASTIPLIIIGSLAIGMTLKNDSEIISRQISEKSIPQMYTTYSSFKDLLNATDAKYFKPVRLSPVGSKKKPTYHGFFFYNWRNNVFFQGRV
jgi:hypothetical protein